MRRFVVVLAVLIAVSPAASAGRSGAAGSASEVMRRFASAWGAADAAAIGALFAPDADLVAPDGVFPIGRAAIVAYYDAAFAHGYAGSTLTGTLIRTRALAPNLTLLDVRFGIEGARRPDGSPLAMEHGALVAVLRNGSGGWQIVAQRERGGDFVPFAQPSHRR